MLSILIIQFYKCSSPDVIVLLDNIILAPCKFNGLNYSMVDTLQWFIVSINTLIVLMQLIILIILENYVIPLLYDIFISKHYK